MTQLLAALGPPPPTRVELMRPEPPEPIGGLGRHILAAKVH